MYNVGDLPRVRVTEADRYRQVLAVFKSIRQPADVRDWFGEALDATVQRNGREDIGETAIRTDIVDADLTFASRGWNVSARALNHWNKRCTYSG